MSKAELVDKCKGCVKADRRRNRCSVFTEPAYMWLKGWCWGWEGKEVLKERIKGKEGDNG